jgi:hypothetical protein
MSAELGYPDPVGERVMLELQDIKVLLATFETQ